MPHVAYHITYHHVTLGRFAVHRRSLKVKVPSASKIAGCPKKNYCDRVIPAHPCIHPPAHPPTRRPTHPTPPSTPTHLLAQGSGVEMSIHCTTEGVRHSPHSFRSRSCSRKLVHTVRAICPLCSTRERCGPSTMRRVGHLTMCCLSPRSRSR